MHNTLIDIGETDITPFYQGKHSHIQRTVVSSQLCAVSVC